MPSLLLLPGLMCDASVWAPQVEALSPQAARLVVGSMSKDYAALADHDLSPHLALWWLAPLAIGLHIFCIKRSTRPFLNSFLFALVFNAIALHWTSTFLGAIPWSILAIGQAVLFMPLGFAHKFGIALYPVIFLLLD